MSHLGARMLWLGMQQSCILWASLRPVGSPAFFGIPASQGHFDILCSLLHPVNSHAFCRHPMNIPASHGHLSITWAFLHCAGIPAPHWHSSTWCLDGDPHPTEPSAGGQLSAGPCCAPFGPSKAHVLAKVMILGQRQGCSLLHGR